MTNSLRSELTARSWTFTKSVSFTIAAAINLVRRLEEHLTTVFPNMPSYQVLAKQSYELELPRENPEGPLDSPIYARCNCIVTIHSLYGKAVFTDSVPAILSQISPNGTVTYMYTTTQWPVSMSADADSTAHSVHLPPHPALSCQVTQQP
jgi:hypothetical protein